MRANLRILMASDDFLPAGTGVGTHLKILAPELVRLGHSVTIVTTRRKGAPAEETWNGVKVFRVFSVPAFGFYQALPSASTLARIVDDIQPDVVHHHYIGYLMVKLSNLALSRGIPQISTYHFSSEVLTQPLPMRPFRALLRRLLVKYNNRFQLIIAPSSNLAQSIHRDGVTTPIRFISNPVLFSGDSPHATEAVRSSGYRVLYAGRLGIEKNIGLLLRAFKDLHVAVPDAALYIAGEGPERRTLERQCSSLGLTGSVHFLGFLDHASLANQYSQCDVFVLPSVIETQGLVAMEAMRFARPIIVTKAIVSANELVDDGRSGFIVDPTDSNDLCSKLKLLHADPVRRLEMGQRSRLRAEAFQPAVVVKQTIEAYQSVITDYQSMISSMHTT